MNLLKSQIKDETHQITKEFFNRHTFNTWGDALAWWMNAEYEEKSLEASSLGQSKFSTDIIWLVSLFGPKKAIDWDIVKVRRVPKLKRGTFIEGPNEENNTKLPQRSTLKIKKRPKRRRN